jgi:hypothetical protein
MLAGTLLVWLAVISVAFRAMRAATLFGAVGVWIICRAM